MLYHAREFINSLSSLHQPFRSTLQLGRLSNDSIALLSRRRSSRWLKRLLTPHLWVIRVLRLLELDPALLTTVVIRIASAILLTAILLLRRAIRRRRCRSTVVVAALLSLVVVILVMLVATLLAGEPASTVAWSEATLAAATGVDASERVSRRA
jgi:hypothetical protein